jgi:hypothetical protein
MRTKPSWLSADQPKIRLTAEALDIIFTGNRN